MNDNRSYSVNGASNSAFSFGDESTNTVTNNYNKTTEDLTEDLLAQLDDAEIDKVVKAELKDIIEAASVASNAEKPKKAIINSFLDSSKSIIDTVAKSPGLIDAYGKWAQFLQNPPSL